MTERDDEIRQVMKEMEQVYSGYSTRLDEQRANQELSYLRAALDAAKRGDLATSMSFVLQARLVRELREKA